MLKKMIQHKGAFRPIKTIAKHENFVFFCRMFFNINNMKISKKLKKRKQKNWKQKIKNKIKNKKEKQKNKNIKNLNKNIKNQKNIKKLHFF